MTCHHTYMMMMIYRITHPESPAQWSVMQQHIASLSLIGCKTSSCDSKQRWPWYNLMPFVFITVFVFSYVCVWSVKCEVCLYVCLYFPCMDAERDGEMILSVSMSPSWPHGGWAQHWPSGLAGSSQLMEHRLAFWLAGWVFSLDNDYSDEMGCKFWTWLWEHHAVSSFHCWLGNILDTGVQIALWVIASCRIMLMDLLIKSNLLLKCSCVVLHQFSLSKGKAILKIRLRALKAGF